MTILRKVLVNKQVSCKSVWFMRQAGRYLPEFRKIRSSNTNFINLCLNSNLSSEITMQPIHRYDLDAAIIFSDILMVPYALGQNVEFIKDEGPKLDKFSLEKFLDNNEKDFTDKLSPVYEAISKTRSKLNKDKTLISFIGAPWTLLIYMLSLNKDKSSNQGQVEKKDTTLILQILNNYLSLHIKNQIDAGADIVQIFDSWSGLLEKQHLNKFCYEPNYKLVNFCREKKIPVICFPKGINENYKNFNNIVKPDGINIDPMLEPNWCKKNLKNVVIQGGLDPKILLKSEKEITDAATKYIETFRDIPYIFNLGHGLLPETDPDNVEKLIKHYRNFK